jgi:hypothetical protein
MTIPALAAVKIWAPFKIDALGLITLLGTDAIRKILGQLVNSPWEYFPLLAGHIVADNSIAEPIPGFILYNITEGTVAKDLNAWFTRWLLSQDLPDCSTELTISTVGGRSKRNLPSYEALAGSVLVNTFLAIWPLLLCDWYGFAASFCLVTMVVTRCYYHLGMTQRSQCSVFRS